MSPKFRNYALTGPEGKQAIEKGLASAHWYVPQIDRKTLRRLMKRDDYHALRDTAILFTVLALTAFGSLRLWQAGWVVAAAVVYLTYATFYTSGGDSRWHECGHGTAFKTKWMNDVMYEIASFMVFRLPDVWRFSHARHHTDTDIVGRDPEADARPLSMWNLFIAFFNYHDIRGGLIKLHSHAILGELLPDERTYVPASDHPACVRKARVWLAVYAAVVAAAVHTGSPAPIMYVMAPYALGAWHFVLVGVFQHAGLAQDVLDHRLNTRTCYINPVSAFIYWNMHYHIEHHIFPMVPYYNLPELHKVLKPQLPKPYGSIWEVYREMIPALVKQATDPDYFIPRKVPPPPPPAEGDGVVSMVPNAEGWVAACTVDEVPPGELLRFDVGVKSYCVYHAEDDDGFYATAGTCTHGSASLGDGLVLGNLIECPKHNGCFDFKTGAPTRLPVKRALATFPTKVESVFGVHQVYVQVTAPKRKEIKYDT
mmetsp:Transcript_22313/g.58224  ORF Transcript_22313/g.58224 Transcript_22313/m.58224 type:complete len:482 (+) Transcript_22313:52-1497(+)